MACYPWITQSIFTSAYQALVRAGPHLKQLQQAHAYLITTGAHRNPSLLTKLAILACSSHSSISYARKINVNGIYPIKDMWITAAEAWREILSHPGKSFLVVTHKSKLRALVCTALGLGPERFRAIDVNNGGICVFNFNKKGEAMLHSLNMTAHMYTDHTYLY